ncbi:ATP synthase subunit I [Candidatus Mcinerneyibacteriota bacterium]|nr:ATP synthase subunit I [Candidatus Mcinerneyibacteriota bacterium]HPE21183.1 ATP synthase subunit I [Candidatus Mcinerneyibacteriales bacterium]HPQ89560.1 ATP synthase subunit I [Candidatus Mcinerneyibacteriales bacterium]
MEYNMMKLLIGKILIFIALIVSTLLYIIFTPAVAFGFAVGILAMLINWKLLAYQNEKVLREKRQPGFVYAFVFLRYAIMGGLLAGAFAARNINGYMALAGLLFSQVYIFVFALILSNKERGRHDA